MKSDGEESIESRFEVLAAARDSAQPPARGWLRAMREELGLGQESVARRMGIKRQSYAQFENAELQGTVSLGSLQRAAEAMGCEVVYFIVPQDASALLHRDAADRHEPVARQQPAAEYFQAPAGQAPGELPTELK